MKLLSEERGALRPSYTWGVFHSVHLAKILGINRVSVIEFGVAGGNGLIALDKVAEKLESIMGVGIDVYGFERVLGCQHHKITVTYPTSIQVKLRYGC